MTIFRLINDLNAKGIELWEENGQLKLKAPKGALTAELREQLVSNKPEIIAFLQDISVSQKHPPILPVSRVDEKGHAIEFPLSFAQERLWFIDQLEPQSAGYNMPVAVTIRGPLNVSHLEQAIQLIIHRHENLRTIFPSQNGRAKQVILDNLHFTLEVTDLTHHESEQQRRDSARQICQAEAASCFDLAKGPLLRGKLLRLAEFEHILMLNMHHIISDGWSTGVMIKEFGLIMDSLQHDRQPQLPTLPVQYLDYSVWQRNLLSGADSKGDSGCKMAQESLLSRQLSYWQQKLQGVPESLDLPTDFPRPASHSFEGARHFFHIDADIARQLKSLAEQQGCTLFMALLAAFNVLLYRYSGQEDICLGSPIANRHYAETEGLIGMFANTLALRNQVESEATFVALLAQVKSTCLEAYEHQDTPFEKIVDAVQPGRNTAISPLFQIMFILQNAPGEAPDDSIQAYPLDNCSSKFDLTLEFSESPKGLSGTIEYSTALFKARTIARLVTHLSRLCQAIIAEPMAKIGQLQFIEAAERQQLLLDFNNTQADYPKDKCIHHLFLEQVASSPDQTAVVFPDQAADLPKQLSYAELAKKSHELALFLQSLGIKPDSFVGLCMDRSPELIIAIMAILRAGGTYVPLDPDYPEERLAYMLQSTQAPVVLTQNRFQAKLSALAPNSTRLITLDHKVQAQTESSSGSYPHWPEIADVVSQLTANNVALRDEVTPEHLAYVIFTSGSTGQPKGVLLKHKTLSNLVAWQQKEPAFAEQGNIINFTGTNFDVFMQEFCSCFASGCSFVIPDVGTVRDSALLARFIVDNQVNKIFLPYVALTYLLEELTLNYQQIPLKHIITAGEQLVISDNVRQFFKQYPDVQLYNHYGPSESHVVTSYQLTGDVTGWKVLPEIGKPIANTQIYILDENNHLVPKGVPGELHIAGDGLAKGYLNRPDLTEQKFVSNPFQPGTLMYKSGDLARWQDDGNIEYLGRMDTQVKIRGFRIETGEIESQLKQYAEIKDCVVIVQGQGANKKLIAFYLAKQGTVDASCEVSHEDVKQHLLQSLPDYMLPSAFVCLDEIPLTPNGKVNRRVLEQMEVSITTGKEYVAPRNETEQQLVNIWAAVLNIAPDSVGVNDNFFELGGHSLLATQLMSRVRKQFAIDVPLKALFAQPTIAAFATLLEQAEEHSESTPVPAILPVARVDEEGNPVSGFALSYAQERIWFIEQLEPNSTGYNIPAAVSIAGEIQIDLLEQAFNLLIARHENLRTIFPSHDGQAQQVVLDSDRFKLALLDLSSEVPPESRQEKAKQLCQAEAEAPFNLATGPLLRGKLLRLSPQEHILVFTMHHIISDGWSMSVMIREFDLIMEALRKGVKPDLAPLTLQYLDFSVWQRKLLDEQGLLEKQLTYWQKKLHGLPESLNLNTDYPRPAVRDFAGDRHIFQFSHELTGQLKTLSEQLGCTLFMTMMAAFKTLLYRYTGDEDICLGSPVANRHYAETEHLIGMFVNTLALRSQVAGSESFTGLLAQVKNTCLEAYEHQDTPFEKIVDLIQPERNLAISPVFQVMLVLQNTPQESVAQTVQPYPLDSDISKFDLTLGLMETAEGLEGSLEYRTSLYKPQTIARMARHFEALCQAIVSHPDSTIDELQYLSAPEKQQLLEEFNRTAVDYPKDKCIHELFIAQVASTPDETAVVFQGKELTYQQLYEQSHTLALYLQSLGVGPDSLVGLSVERSVEMIVAILGILQAGAAYVPLDPAYPDDRLAYMLQDSRSTILLTQEKLQSKLQSLMPESTRLVALDQQWAEINHWVRELSARQTTLRKEVKPHHLAYVIYTSGSTGKPKGVMLQHRSVMNYLNYCLNHYFADEQQGSGGHGMGSQGSGSIVHFPLAFDASVTALFAPLLKGKTVEVLSGDPMELFSNGDFLDKGYDFVKLTPGHLQLLKNNADTVSPETFKNKNLLILGGEALTAEHIDFLQAAQANIELVNEYGPTETTVGCTVARFTVDSDEAVTIGKPIDNTQIYILDSHNHLVPVGVPGELHIAGDGLARGYLNRPELTEEKFIANPFADEQFKGTARMYKSGDLAMWREDGTIAYLGRIDTQVKIRGFRIETGEIEAQLNKHPEVNDAVVVVVGQGADKKLVAFYVASKADNTASGENLKTYLLQSLPEFMIPSSFVSLEAMPLTPNGKVNRQALETMEVSLESQQRYVAPRNETEQQLVVIWSELLGVSPDSIGVHDNFFELGGHSLLATRLMSRVRQNFSADLPLKAIFAHTSIAGFASLLSSAKASEIPPILPVKRTRDDGSVIDSFPLSYAQERLWFIAQMEAGSAGYNIPGAISIFGDIDIAMLEQAFNLIIARHENLRTIFTEVDGKPQQVILNNVDFRLKTVDLSLLQDDMARHRQAKELCQQEAATAFDLAQGPLIRGTLLKLSEQQHILALTLHHIVSDGWSTGVMIQEFSNIMNRLRQGLEPDLTPLPIQYLDYSVWQRTLLDEGGLLQRQLSYWQEKLAGLPESLDLATDYPRPAVPEIQGETYTFSLGTDLSRQLKHLTEQQDCTLFITLLTAFNVLLYRYTGQDDICIGTPIANRQYGEIESLIGMFVNTLALRNQVDSSASFLSLLAQVKNTCLDAYEHQDTPFEKIVEAVQPERNMSLSPLFQVMFALQNTHDLANEEHHVHEENTAGSGSQDIRPYELDFKFSKFDLTLAMTETSDGICAGFEYRTSLFRPETIERMARHFIAVCQAITNGPATRISQLNFIDEAEQQQLLTKYNDTWTGHQQGKFLHHLFMEQVERHPQKTALNCQGQTLSYQQLHQRSQTLALYLQAQGVQPDTLVGLCVERTADMVVAILAILQAGGAYVPLDPSYPEDRLAYMLEDCQASLVLAQASTQEKISGPQGNDIPSKERRVILLDQQWPEIVETAANLTADNVTLQQNQTCANLAYVIYTSGSTGRPKGVEVEHGAVVAFLSNPAYVDAGQVDKVASLSSFAFDGFIFDLFFSLSFGATLYLYQSDDYVQPMTFKALVQEDDIDTFFVTTALFNQYVANDSFSKSNIKQVLFGGEKCDPASVQKAKQRYPEIAFINVYGPTETIVYASCCHLNKLTDATPIGRAINNNRLLILDENRNLTPLGAVGELYIGGDSLARGYLNRPELTQERFISNPFFNPNDPGSSSRLYRTGDLVRMLEDGNIDFIGRADGQVKIRGFRIEPGEIAAQLNQYDDIIESVVLAIGPQGSQRLIAYYVADAELSLQADNQEILRNRLRQSLPDYMVPAAFVSLDKLPLTPNGKVDRRALEKMDVNLVSEQHYVAPRNETETQLQTIWSEVLGIESQDIGIQDNFFELGGHSLLATQVISRVRTLFGQELPLKTLFEKTCIAEFSKLIEPGSDSVSATKVNVADVTIPRVNRVAADGSSIDSFVLSYAQERLWFIDQLEPNSAGYNISNVVSISGELHVEQLEQAFNLIIARHENLRTVFPLVEGKAQQVILKHIAFSLEKIDLSEQQDQIIRHDRAKAICQEEAGTPFNLATGPLIRGKLLKLAPQEHILALTIHHIIGDGWSMGVMTRELGEMMVSLRAGLTPQLPPLPVQYADYSVWQRQRLEEIGDAQQSLLQKQLSYWQNKLADAPEYLNLCTDFLRPAVQDFAGANHVFRFDARLSEQLVNLAEQQDCTLYMTLLAAFNALLYRYTGQHDICLGSPIANRQFSETEGLIGMFVNTLALRNQVEAEASFTELLAQVKSTCLDAYDHQDAPFEKVVEAVQPDRNMAQNPIFQIMFVLQNAPQATADNQIRPYALQSDISKFDLTIAFTQGNNGLEGVIEYRTSLFRSQTITRMAHHLEVLCRSVVDKPDTRVCQLNYIGDAERKLLLQGFNNTQAEYPKEKCIHDVFVAQANQYPDSTAVIFQDETLTYRQLAAQSEILALYLQSVGVTPDTLVALCMERSTQMMVAILGILRAGGAYVPLDTDYPDDRLAYMLNDCQANIVITQDKLTARLNTLTHSDTQLLALDKQWTDIVAEAGALQRSGAKLRHDVTSTNLAYVIYTSGSTGLPKGVMVEHKAVNRLVINSNFIDISQQDTFLQFASLSFDAATFEIWGALLNGAKLVIPPAGKEAISQLGQMIANYQVSVLWLTSGLFQLLVKDNIQQLTGLRVLLSGGDVVPIETTRHFKQYCPDAIFVNGYGPTENTTFTSCYAIEGSMDDKLNALPIGRPVANTQVYIVDEHRNPVPVGVPGELVTAGDGLARGYLNQPALNAEKFIANPFAEDERQGRMYRTGDLARWLDDGNIEYLGRIDTQVKIRGFRIEVGEIEAHLKQHPAVKNAVVIVKGDALDKHLVAFYVLAQQDIKVTQNILKGHLQETLPDYMLPAAFVALDNIPLTSNGKIDRRALTQIEVSIESDNDYLAPRNDSEKRLVAIWSEVLGLAPEKVGVNDDFFDLGGQSLLAVKLMAKINSQFGQSLSLATLFSASTIDALAECLTAECLRTDNAVTDTNAAGQILVPIQPRGDNTPVFAVPGAGGNVISFRALGEALGDEQPFYGLQAIGLDGKTAPLESIEETAQANISALKTVQPQGPYRLLGHSYGGVVAFEMARQLMMQNQEVHSLTLLDSFAPAIMQQLSSGDDAQITLEVGIALCKLYGLTPDVSMSELQQLSESALGEYLSHLFSRNNLEMPLAQFEAFQAVYKANVKCYQMHQPQPLQQPLNVLLCRATQRSDAMTGIPDDLGWTALLPNTVDILDIDANHFSMLEKSSVQPIVSHITGKPALMEFEPGERATESLWNK